MKPLRLAVLGVTLVATFALPATAQPVISAKSGLLSYFEGQVLLNDQQVEFSSTHFADVKENSIIKTADGRAEVLLTPGVTLRMGENSSLRMISNRLVDTRVELLTGSAVVEADMIAKDTNVTLVVGQGSVELPRAGLYRFDAVPAGIKVFKGDADVEIAGQSKAVFGAHMLSLTTETAAIEKFDTEDTDSLDRWSHQRGSYLAMANMSAARSLNSTSGTTGLLGSGLLGGVGIGGVPGMWGMGGMCSPMGGYGAYNNYNAYNNGFWGYNSYYGMMTFVPCMGSFYSPYGYQFWSPRAIAGRNWVKPPVLYGGGSGRTIISPSGSAWLARPTIVAHYRGISQGTGSAAVRTVSNSSAAPAVNGSGARSGVSSSSGSTGRSSGGFSGGGAGGGGGAHGGGSAGGGHR